MKNAVILHGTESNSKEHWFPWLANILRERGYSVWVPDLPGCDRPNIDRYNEFIFKSWTFDADSIIVGYSSGAVSILGILENLPDGVVIDQAILVAGFIDNLKWDSLKELFVKPFDWEKIKRRAKRFVLLHSDDDPYVSLTHGEMLKEKLGGTLVVLPKRGHYNTNSKGNDLKEFPELLEIIKQDAR